MAKEFKYRGKTLEELQSLSMKEFALLLDSRNRRSIMRGLPENQKKFLENMRRNRGTDKITRTKSRDMVILPEMVGSKIGIHNGKEFKLVVIEEFMLGHRLGEFSHTRGRIKHSSPGFGATRSSKFVPLK